jgi:hypothetical protein
MFLRGACPIHNPEKSAEAGKLYWDGCRPSDQYPLVDENGNGFSELSESQMQYQPAKLGRRRR